MEVCSRSWLLAKTARVFFGIVVLAVVFLSPAAEARSSHARKLQQLQGCQPDSVPKEDRCTYVRTQKACQPEDGWIPYLEVHYCLLDQMELASTTLFLMWIGVLFALMLVVAERFFCPSLELISEYLRLPPCVAGATLLSFGNGAPDVFTQLAAISQGDTDEASASGVSMALSEPLGSGLFVGNIVFGLVILFSGVKEIRVQASYFLKDVLFYLGGVITVFAFLLHGVVSLWEVGLLAAYYLAFMATTILMSRHDEPVHADPRLHEVPHRLRPMDSFLRESFRRESFRIPDTRFSFTGSDAAGGDVDEEAPLLPGRGTLEPIDEGACCGGPADGEGEEGEEEPLLPAALSNGGASGGEREKERSKDHNGGAVERATAAGAGAATEEEDEFMTSFLASAVAAATTAAAQATAPPPTFAMMYGGGAGRRSRDGEGSGSGGGAGRASGGGATNDGSCSLCAWGSPGVFGGGGGGGGGGHMDRTVSLDRTSTLRREGSGKPPGPMQRLWRRLERPGLALLSVFMPRIATGTHARYRKTYAVLLPPLLPTLVGAAQGWLDLSDVPRGLWAQPWWRISTAIGVAVGLAALVYYPRKGHLHGYAAGIATVAVFAEAMVLLDGSAGELVSAAVALGQIYGISPSLLGATLLAWGNSVSDLVSNITLARDGLPSMAITACFASPLFTLLAGLVTSLTYATRHGDMDLPQDLALRVLYGCSTTILLMWALVVPLVFRWRLSRAVGVLAIAVYMVYQTVYILAVIHDSRA